MWGSKTAKMWTTTAYGQLYISTDVTLALPISSKTAVIPAVSVQSSGVIWTAFSGGDFLDDFRFKFVSPTRLEGLDVYYYWTAKGTWK